MEELNFVSFAEVGQYRAGLTGQGTASVSGDPFLQIILQMVESSKENEQLAAQAWLNGGAEDISDEQYASAGMALVEAMGGMQSLVQMMQFSNLAQTEQNNFLRAVGENMNERSLNDPLAVLKSLAEAAAQDTEADVLPEVQILSADYTENRAGLESGTSSEESEQAVQMPLEQNGSFVQNVKAELQNQRKTTDAGEETAVQSQVDLSQARVFENVGALRLERPAAQQPAETLTSQITAKLNENLEAGTREFTMRLKPDSLGELTIRILSKDNKMTLSIVTETKEAADLLNRELVSLKQAVSPMEVEVRPVVHEQQAQTVEQSFLRFDEQERQNRGQQRREREQNQNDDDGFASAIEELFGGELVQAAHFI